jgi:peptide/nickel transport system permease protein
MRNYIIRRLLIMIPTLLIVSFLIFFTVALIPGNMIDTMSAADPEADLDREAIARTLGLDAPLIVQYGRWLGVAPQKDGSFDGIFQGNFGNSWWRKSTVLALIADKWPVTFELGILGLVVAQLIALPIGIYSALRQDKLGDYLGRSFAILCISVPGFWLGTMIIVYPSIWWGYMPPIMLIEFVEDPIGNLGMFIIPSIVLGMALGGMTMRMTRTMMLEVMRQDFIRTAWSKGLKESVVVLRHALKNALIPVVTVIGLQLPVLLGGTVIIENIFGLPGMGRLILNSVVRRDEPLVSGTLFFFSVGLMLFNLVVDLTYAYLDPRVHYEAQAT